MDAGIIWVVLVIMLYFLPTFVAKSRHHRSGDAITLLNLVLGWTVLGWLVALIWAATGDVETAANKAPSPDTHVKCPDCAELVLKEARVCKHCGCRLQPQTA
jgi:heme/copper-type cytochrome/quinol oxidase subunit 2